LVTACRFWPAQKINQGTGMNHITLKDNWSAFKEKLKRKYSNLTENDLAFVLGKEDEMIDQIQRKTGESRDQIEKYVREECTC
jgi:uncharacterized protein YjbJ (UPF0337 family)